jgi:diguanylate cyclase (GGDEF)-like protein/PAS domain S-box-containing protein
MESKHARSGAAQGEWDPTELFAGRYQLVADLKRGNGVDTYLSVDASTSTQVVVKCIDKEVVHAAARLRFEHETRVLRQLTGTGLTGLYDAGSADDRLYLVQPFVPGSTLETLLKAGPLPLASVLQIGIDIAAALDTAHGAGICHRDVKPANVIVDGVEPVGTVTLIDFGFARSLWLDESVRDELVGTVRYFAPEAAGLLPAPADERSDLYALGILLYEAVIGRPPFPGPTVGDLLRQHLSMPVPDLRDGRPEAPRALDAILRRLLNKEPADRYQSASAVVHDLSALLAALEAGDPDPRVTVGRTDHRRSLTDPAFVGRDAEVASLQALVTEIDGGGSGLVLLEADSGGGKSRLLAEIAAQTGNSKVMVLHGQGVAKSAQLPFTLFQGVARDLATIVESVGISRESFVERIGDTAAAVVRALPSLRSLLDVPQVEDNAPEKFGEQRNLAALRHLLASLASPEHPVLLVLDDCQWADQLTVRLIAETFALGTEPLPYLGVVAAFRSEEVAEDHALRHIPAGSPLHLGPLSDAAMRQLAESMAGPLPHRALDTVIRLADGSPFMGAAVLRGLVECGALIGSDDGWRVEEAAMAEVQTARRSAAFLVRRLDMLSEGAVRVLSAGGVLGKEFDIVKAVQLAGESESAAAILDESVRCRLLWVDRRSGRCIFSHDKIREALLARLDSDTRRSLHSKAADTLLNQDVDDVAVFELAYHLDAAGRHDAALPHALRAAELARGQYGLDSAVTHYRMAERGVAPDDMATRIVIAEGLGDVLTLQGVYGEAEAQLATAQSLAEERVHKAALDGKLGGLAFKQGDVATARHHLEGGMARLGRPVPRNAAFLVCCLVWEVLVQATHTLFPRLTTGRRSPEGNDEDFLAMRIHSLLAYLYWFYSGKVTCAWSHLRGMNLAERYTPSPELGQAYSEHAPVMTMLPWFGRALDFAQRSLEIRRANGDVWGQGQSQSFAGVTLYAASRFDEAEDACREAIHLLESTGDQWEVNTAGWNLATVRYRKGDLLEAAKVARNVYRSAMSIGDQTSAGVALSVWTRASGGRVDAQLIEDELGRGSEDASTTTELLLAAGLCALRSQDLDAASAHLEKATATIRRAGLRQEYVAPVACWNATVARLLTEQAPAHDPSVRARMLRRTAKKVRRARFWAFSYRNNAPHALRESGLLASLKDRPRRANKLLERSLRVAESQGARYEAALTRQAIAQVAQARGGSRTPFDEASEEVRGFEAFAVPVTDSIVTVPSLSVFDRFTTLLRVGRNITAAPNVTALETAIRDAALTLLRGERCHLVNVSGPLSDRLTSDSGEAVDLVSQTLLNRAIEAGTPVVASDPTADESESLVLSGIRSVLAAPIVVHGETLSCFYVTHEHIGQLYGDEEIQLAAFVANLAGAAFEHLAGAETRFRSIGQNSSDVLTLVDRSGVVTYQSSAASRVFALSTPGLVGRPILDWVHADDRELFKEALERGEPDAEVRIECRLFHADGSFRYAETAVTNLLDNPAVDALVLNTHDVTDRRRLQDELHRRALSDRLTGLPNRALFLERTQHALAARSPAPLVVCFLDLDDFKAVNDGHGHGAGDKLLINLGERLADCLRPSDTVARFGGDEFAILFEDTNLATALDIVERLLERLTQPISIGDTEVVIHASIGVAPSDERHTGPDQLLAEADAAMYTAKASGGNCASVFKPAMRVAAESRSRVRTDIDQALLNNEFLLFYQPIVHLESGVQRGVEALVRWMHPERGLLTPADFIDTAETSGQIVDIGQWVLGAACQAPALLNSGGYVSVNISARQLRLPNLVQVVSDALEMANLFPDRLVLEITETATVGDVEGAIDRLVELKELGLKIALDDFGTGYSPLSYLRSFPVDFLKIDRSFVRNIAHSPEDRAIVGGVIDIAHALGLATIAEGVETPSQREIMTELGCDLGQGYLWVRPAPLADLPELVAVSAGVPTQRVDSG